MEEIPAPDDLCFGEEEGFLLLEGDEDEDEDEEKASQDTVEMGGGGAKPKSAESSPDARSSPEKETACQCAGTEEDAEEAAEDSLKQNRATRGEEDSVDEEDGQQRKPEGFCAPTTPSAVDASSCAPSALSFVGAAAWGHAAHGSKQARWKPGCGRPPPAPLPHPSIPPPDLVIPPFPQDDSELPPPCGASREEGEKARDRPDTQASATSKVPEPGVRLASARAEEHDSGVALEREIEAAPPAVTAASLCAAPLSGACCPPLPRAPAPTFSDLRFQVCVAGTQATPGRRMALLLVLLLLLLLLVRVLLRCRRPRRAASSPREASGSRT